IALSFCDTEEREYLRDIHKLIDQSITIIEDHPFPSAARFVQNPVVQKNPLSRKPASHANFRRTRNWRQA
ncbi:MAG: ATP-dependent helicase, partial [Chitinophagaceae bacterium]|nr:ATP-dependent helicase [Chitinophagaceae bacterium]